MPNPPNMNSFPSPPLVDGQLAQVNGILYNYSTSTNSWRRNDNTVLQNLFIGGTAQPTNTSTGALIIPYGGASIGGNLYLGGNFTDLGNSSISGSLTVGGPVQFSSSLVVNGSLTANSDITLSPSGANVSIKPSGLGTVSIFPGAPGSMDNVAIGSTNPSTAKFTSLQVTGPTTLQNLTVQGTIIGNVSGGFWTYINSNYQSVIGDKLLIDTSSSSITVTLPLLNVSTGSSVSFIDYSGTFGTKNLIFQPSTGTNIYGTTGTLIVNVNNAANSLIYSGNSQGWLLGVV